MQPFPCSLGTSTFMTPLLPAGGWQAVLQPSSSPLTHYEFDVLISAGGGKFVPEGDTRCPCSPRTNVGGWVGAHSSPLLQGSSGRRRVGSWPLASPPTSSTATAGPRWRWLRSAAWPESTTRSSSRTSTTKRVSGPNPRRGSAGGSCPLLRELEAQPQDVPSGGVHFPTWYPTAGDIWCLSPVLGHPVALAQPLPRHQASTWKTSCTTRMTLTISS